MTVRASALVLTFALSTAAAQAASPPPESRSPESRSPDAQSRSSPVEPKAHAASPPIDWSPYTLESFDGDTLEAELGTLEVPENRRAADRPSEKVTLHFVRLKSTAERPGAPIVYLSGGPGASGIWAGRWALDDFRELSRVADVILLDQRGTGLSDRGLFCAGPEGPPDLNLFAAGEAQTRAVLEVSADCRRQLAERGIDLAGYTTPESADDLEALRRALDVPTISLLGFSYGTHLGLEMLRRHGEVLERVVLIGTEGPDHTRKLPSTLDTHLRKLSLLAARRPEVAAEVPDFYALLRKVLTTLEKDPIDVPIEMRDGTQLTLPVNAEGLRALLAADLGDASDFPFFPALLRTIDRGDPSLLAWFARKRFSPTIGIPALYFAVDGASGISPERRLRIEREAEQSVMGSGVSGFFEVRDALGVEPLGESFRSPVVSDVETLFVSGALDANTPPHQAEEMRWGLPRSSHLVIDNAGHEDMFGWDALTDVLVRFFKDGDVSEVSLARPEPRFLTVAEAKKERLGE
ncbi:MAG: alpha/beta hydrolase [Acidobacteriota bacterium]